MMLRVMSLLTILVFSVSSFAADSGASNANTVSCELKVGKATGSVEVSLTQATNASSVIVKGVLLTLKSHWLEAANLHEVQFIVGSGNQSQEFYSSTLIGVGASSGDILRIERKLRNGTPYTLHCAL